MPTIDRQLREAWDALRAEGAQRRDYLRAVRIRHLRGIQDLRVTFPYPVSVLAGPNGSGKSTVLFACACGYQDPDRNPRDLAPGSLFPNFSHGRQGELSDAVETTELGFDYVQDGESYSMSWKRGKSWNRTFMGRRGGRQSRDQLSILCEDAVAEAIVRGVLDVLNAEMGLRHDDFVVGRNTGRDEFPGHIRTLGKFGRLRDFLVVLDGDSRDLEKTIEGAAEEYGQRMRPLFLPDHRSPEFWIWKTLGGQTGRYGDELGLSATGMARRMREIERRLPGSVRPRDRAKAALGTFAEELDRTAEDLARIAGRREAEAKRGEMGRFRVELKEQINAWRQEG